MVGHRQAKGPPAARPGSDSRGGEVGDQLLKLSRRVAAQRFEAKPSQVAISGTIGSGTRQEPSPGSRRQPGESKSSATRELSMPGRRAGCAFGELEMPIGASDWRPKRRQDLSRLRWRRW